MNKTTELKKLVVGETVSFEDIALAHAETKFGTATIVNFADAAGKIVRKCYAQGGMLEFLKQNPGTKSITLKKKLVDGEYSYNVWA